MTWRAFSTDESGSPVGVSLEKIMKRLGLPSASVTTTICQHWVDVVGPVIAEHATPQVVVDGALVVEVDDPAWRTELKWMGGQVADRLNDALGEHLVERLDIRVPRRRKSREK